MSAPSQIVRKKTTYGYTSCPQNVGTSENKEFIGFAVNSLLNTLSKCFDVRPLTKKSIGEVPALREGPVVLMSMVWKSEIRF